MSDDLRARMERVGAGIRWVTCRVCGEEYAPQTKNYTCGPCNRRNGVGYKQVKSPPPMTLREKVLMAKQESDEERFREDGE